ncbi:hypothetical protein J9303_18470 [Bacillaceae bacterium Marseille-Q3522]|nr:hypothetical protein [Bacillaceae bacterium Marseille-Q3522]
MDYFDSIHGLNLLEIPPRFHNGLKNGDYVAVYMSGPMQESYPMRSNSISEITILHNRVGE